jgi:hypothetical protein
MAPAVLIIVVMESRLESHLQRGKIIIIPHGGSFLFLLVQHLLPLTTVFCISLDFILQINR